jgi:retron-type reverse transcriptase
MARTVANEKTRELQRTLYRAAKADPQRRFHALYDKVLRRDVLERAWEDVRRNRGAAGIDRQTIADVEGYGIAKLLDDLQRDLKDDSYRALPARRVFIPKPGRPDEQRPLSIPAVCDRVVQAAVKTVIEPIFEADMLECSFGFRPRRSTHDALQVLVDEAWKGKRWVVETDIASCFEEIPHDRLMTAIEERISDRHLLKLLRAMLRAGVMQDGVVTRSGAGTPQGGVVSPVLCNVYLHRLDRQWARRGRGTLVRYADDRVPRTLKEGRCRRRYRRMRCCTRDEGARSCGLVALRGRPAGGGRKPPRGASVKSRGAERRGKGVLSARQVQITKASASEPPMKCRKRIGDIQNRGRVIAPGGAWREPADWPGGCPAWMVARAWSGLLCGTGEPVALFGRPASGAVLACGWSAESENSKQQICEGESSCAGHRGGPSRSSGEGPVMGLERRGRVVRAGFQVNRDDVGGAG